MSNHSKALTLLPWFVNGTLNETEQSLVAAHLDDCEECRVAVDRLIAVSASFNAPDDVVAAWEQSARPAAADFIDRLDEQPALPATEERSHAPWFRRHVRGVIAACTVIAVALGITLSSPEREPFRTLSRPFSGTESRPIVQIVFSPDATEASIRRVLLQDGNEVLSGPTRQGVYRVALGKEQRSDVFVARLKHNPDVIYVEQETRP